MEQYEIRIRLASTATPEEVTALNEVIMDMMEDDYHSIYLYNAAGPIEATTDEWAIYAPEKMNEMMD